MGICHPATAQLRFGELPRSSIHLVWTITPERISCMIEAMSLVTGSLGIHWADTWYTLQLGSQGWRAAEMVQFLADAQDAGDPRNAILKLLGFTLLLTSEPPPRKADHWVEVDLQNRSISTNSDFIRKAVKQERPTEADRFHQASLERTYHFLDEYDYTVELYR